MIANLFTKSDNINLLFYDWQHADPKEAEESLSKLLPHLRTYAKNIIYRMFLRENEDLQSEIVNKAVLTASQKFDGSSTFSTWFHALAVNACLQEIRKFRLQKRKGQTFSLENLPHRDYIKLVSRGCDADSSNDYLDLSEEQLRVLNLREDGFSNKEIAKKTNLSRRKIKKICKSLRKRFLLKED